MRAARLIIALSLLAPVVPALATVIPLDFNTVTLTGIAGNGLGATAGSTTIQTWLTNALQSRPGFGSATATVSGALATATYNGEGRVVETLGTSDGPVPTHHGGNNDTFIINDDFGLHTGLLGPSHSFTITFTGLTIYSLSFDWEIFPDFSCASGSVSGALCAASGPGPTNPNWPDIALLVDGGATPVWSAQALAGVNPQALGNTGTLNFAGGIHTLTVMDWPAEVGMDNLTINACPSTLPNCVQKSVPEPSPLALAGLALALLALVRWKAPRGRVAAR